MPLTTYGQKMSDFRVWTDLLRQARFGTLSTHSQQCEGFPFGSLVECYLEESGNVLFFLSSLAEHTKNIKVASKASLLICGDDRSNSILECPRVTLLGQITSRTQREGLPGYLLAHPQAQRYVGLPDFEIYQLEVEAARYVAGFGQMGWWRGAELEILRGAHEGQR